MYELFYLVPTSYTDAEVQGVMEKIAGMVAKAGGKVTRSEMLSRQKLAYPIKGNRHGVYALLQFDGEPAMVNSLDRQWHLTDEVLRHQLTLMPSGADKKAYKLTPYVAPLSEEGRQESARPPRQAPPPVPARAGEASMNVEAINKKLDEMLDEDIAKKA